MLHYTTAVDSAYTEAHKASGKLVVANDETGVGKGKTERTAKFWAKINKNPEASEPQNYNLGGRTSNGNYDKPEPDSINRQLKSYKKARLESETNTTMHPKQANSVRKKIKKRGFLRNR
jgi:hypothetical protein